MDKFLTLNIVRNELENCITDAKNTFKLDEFDILYVLQSIMNNTQQKAITREAYNLIPKNETKSEE